MAAKKKRKARKGCPAGTKRVRVKAHSMCAPTKHKKTRRKSKKSKR